MARLGACRVSGRHEYPSGDRRVRPRLPGRRRRADPAFRGLRGAAEARLTMIMILLYAAGGVAIGIYMLAALLRPEKF